MSPLSTYDPTSFAEDVFIITFKGLGRGKGFAIASEQSLFSEVSDPELYEMLRARIGVLHILFEEEEEEAQEQEDLEEYEEEKELSELERELRFEN